MKSSRFMSSTLFLLALGIAFPASSPYAFSFDVISDSARLTQKDALLGVSVSDLAVDMEAIYSVSLSSGEVTQDGSFALDRETGQITFGDGLRGTVPPSGGAHTAAAYRHGAGSTDVVSTTLPIFQTALPFFIPIDDPSTKEIVEMEISFFLKGIKSLDLEVVRNGVWITGISAIPEPATMLLLGCGLFGLASLRRRFRK